VSSWTSIRRDLARLDQRLQLIQTSRGRGVRSPGEPTLVLCTEPFHHVRNALEAFAPDAPHIATDGALTCAVMRRFHPSPPIR
jgi:hypothetical protein